MAATRQLPVIEGDVHLPGRRQTPTVDVGGVPIGSRHPIVVQSMTNTDTADADGTALQVAALAHAGSELVRITVNNDAAAEAVPLIRRKLDDLGVGVPLIGDFHYNGHQLLVEYPLMAGALAKYRINPGNVGAKRHDENFATIIRVALEHDRPVRIGVNWGSLDQALLTNADGRQRRAAHAGRLARRDDRGDDPVGAALGRAGRGRPGMAHDQIIISAKVCGYATSSTSIARSPARCDYPLHLGLTEAGMGMKGIVASTAGLSTAARGGHRRHDPRLADPGARRRPDRGSARRPAGPAVARLRSFTPQVSACPGCGRTTSTFFQEMAEQIQGYLRKQMPVWSTTHPGVEEMRVAVMGCVVNGPGESKHADIGISLPGTFEEPVAPVFVDGALRTTLRGEGLVKEFITILDDYVARRYGAAASAS